MSKEVETKVAVIKLITGEEILATMKLNLNENVLVNFPACAYPTPDGRVSLRPWMYCIENLTLEAWIPISPMSVITICTPVKEMEDAYNELKEKHFSAIHRPTVEEQKVILSGSNTIH